MNKIFQGFYWFLFLLMALSSSGCIVSAFAGCFRQSDKGNTIVFYFNWRTYLWFFIALIAIICMLYLYSLLKKSTKNETKGRFFCYFKLIVNSVVILFSFITLLAICAQVVFPRSSLSIDFGISMKTLSAVSIFIFAAIMIFLTDKVSE